MGTSGHTPVTLDDLAERARNGDRESERVLFTHLRERFLILAKRRVSEGDVEDVVQEALRIVAAKVEARDPERAILPWSLTVLRNVVGNHYQRTARDSGVESFEETTHSFGEGVASTASIGLGPIEEAEAIDRVVAGITQLEETHPRCGVMFRMLLEAAARGGSSREISKDATERVRREYPDLGEGNFHVALHRCRQRLRSVLEGLERAET